MTDGIIPQQQPHVKTELSSTLLTTLDLITNLTKQRGYCYASNGFLSNALKCNERTIRRRLADLTEAGYIVVTFVHGERHVHLMSGQCPGNVPPTSAILRNCGTLRETKETDSSVCELEKKDKQQSHPAQQPRANHGFIRKVINLETDISAVMPQSVEVDFHAEKCGPRNLECLQRGCTPGNEVPAPSMQTPPPGGTIAPTGNDNEGGFPSEERSVENNDANRGSNRIVPSRESLAGDSGGNSGAVSECVSGRIGESGSVTVSVHSRGTERRCGIDKATQNDNRGGFSLREERIEGNDTDRSPGKQREHSPGGNGRDRRGTSQYRNASSGNGGDTFGNASEMDRRQLGAGNAMDRGNTDEIGVQLLTAEGVEIAQARLLGQQKSLFDIQRAITYLRQTEAKGHTVANPAGFLVAALTKGWGMKLLDATPEVIAKRHEKVRLRTDQETALYRAEIEAQAWSDNVKPSFVGAATMAREAIRQANAREGVAI
jgi:hypothetical protein